MVFLRRTLSTLFDLLHSGSDTAVHEMLTLLLDFFQVDRVSFGGFQDNRQGMFTIGQAYAGSYGSVPGSDLDYIPISGLEWDMEPIFRMEPITVDDLETYTGTEVDRSFFLQAGVRSICIFPSVKEEEANGYVVMETFGRTRRWTEWDIECARLFAHLISVTVEKALIDRKLITSARQILEHETIFRIIFNNLVWCVEVYDEHGLLIDINEAGLQLFGTTRNDILGLQLFESMNLSQDKKDKLLAGEIVYDDIRYDFGKNSRCGYYESCYKNEVKYLMVRFVPMKNARNHTIGYLLLAYDNTDNYLKNKEVQRLLFKMKTAVDTGKSFLMDYDLPANRLHVDFSMAFTPTADVIVRFWKEISQSPHLLKQSIHPEDIRTYNHHIYQLKTGKRTHCTFVFRHIIEEKTHWFRASLRTYKWDKQQKAEKIVAYLTDITQEKEKEIKLFKTREAEKLKSAFMANISHEIRTPLNAIVGFSNILADANSTEETESFRNTINHNNVLLLQLVDDLLDFSQIEVGTLQYRLARMPVRAVCEEVVESYELMLAPEVSLVFQADAPDIHIYADRKRVRQVVSQLVGNAIKYTQQGRITLSYEVDDDEMLLLKVSDTGIGIPREETEFIFNYFYQVDHFNQGTGLGLAVAKSMIEGMGGRIGVDSTEGSGSVFWFTLPLGAGVPA